MPRTSKPKSKQPQKKGKPTSADPQAREPYKKVYIPVAEKVPPNIQHASYLIPEWCARRRMSESMYFKIRKMKKGPKETRAGKHVTISHEADAEWVKQREEESQQELAAEIAAKQPTAAEA